MDTNKILVADMLDLIFDDRNKAYGAYELRKTYNRRIGKSLLFTLMFASLIIAGVSLGNSFKKTEGPVFDKREIIIEEISEEIKEPKPAPPPERRPEPEPIRTEQLSTLAIVPDVEQDKPIPTKEDLDSAKIGLFQQDGRNFTGQVEGPPDQPDHAGILDSKRGAEEEDKIYPIVEIQAKYRGNWEKFLLRHLNGNTPVDNGASPGRYTVLIQFIVDKEGNVSDIKAISNVGYGMEAEAIRVLRKADKWEPAIQAGFKVKSYRTQPITFVVEE